MPRPRGARERAHSEKAAICARVGAALEGPQREEEPKHDDDEDEDEDDDAHSGSADDAAGASEAPLSSPWRAVFDLSLAARRARWWCPRTLTVSERRRRSRSAEPAIAQSDAATQPATTTIAMTRTLARNAASPSRIIRRRRGKGEGARRRPGLYAPAAEYTLSKANGTRGRKRRMRAQLTPELGAN